MTKTTRVLSVSVPVADQDEAIRFYTEVLGCELQVDEEIWPGARLVQVLPPGSDVALVLLPPDSPIPVAVRLGTTDAQEAYDRVAAAITHYLAQGTRVFVLDIPPSLDELEHIGEVFRRAGVSG